jgi:uncharacterized protein (DUF433 family)
MASAIHRPTTSPEPVERTDHPHVVKSKGTLGGKARIDGTRMSVYLLWTLHQAGTTVDEIIATYPWLGPAQVYDAISFAYDHPDEMVETAERQRLRSILKEHDLRYYGGFLLGPDQALPSKVPPGTPIYTWETLPPDFDE